MNVFYKSYCRVYQFIFKCSIPALPYRKPEILDDQDKIGVKLNELNINRVLIVTDKGIVKVGLLDYLLNCLKEKSIETYVYDGTVPNPTSDNVEEARNLYLENNCGAIIALGGGSPIDLAKAVGARIVKPNKSLYKMKGLFKVCKKLPPLFVIPTTAGTGSETTVTSVITDSNTHHKYLINDFSLIPHYAVLDYKVTLGLPPHITSTTGMDALTHAIEAFIGNTRTNETKKMSMEATKLIVSSLKTCYSDPTNAEARTNMLYASHYAGIAFTKAYVGYVHAIAHTLGGKYGVAHGLANSVILPVMLEAYGEKIYKKLAVLSRYSGLANEKDSDEIASKNFINWIKEANKEMNIPSVIEQVKAEDIDEMVETALKEGNPLYPVPVLMGKEEFKRIYLSIMKE